MTRDSERPPASERGELERRGEQLVTVAREGMLARIVEPDMLDLFFDALKARMAKGARCSWCGQDGLPTRDGYRTYAQILKLIDAPSQVNVAIANFLGVQPEVAQGYIARGQAADAGAENPLDAAERFVDALVVLCEAHPECRRIVARLGSYAVVEGTEAG